MQHNICDNVNECDLVVYSMTNKIQADAFTLAQHLNGLKKKV